MTVRPHAVILLEGHPVGYQADLKSPRVYRVDHLVESLPGVSTPVEYWVPTPAEDHRFESVSSKYVEIGHHVAERQRVTSASLDRAEGAGMVTNVGQHDVTDHRLALAVAQLSHDFLMREELVASAGECIVECHGMSYSSINIRARS